MQCSFLHWDRKRQHAEFPAVDSLLELLRVTVDVFGQFGVAVTVEAHRSSLAVRGEVDLATAPTLRGLVHLLIDHGSSRLILDLANVTFLDASGLGVLSEASARLARSGGRLTLRSVPRSVRRTLDISGVAALVEFDEVEHAVRPLGAEERADQADTATGRPAPRNPGLSRFGALPASNDTVDAALRLVVALASATVAGADGVSVSLHRHGRMMTAAASDDTILQMDYDQYATGEGPCLSAAAEGHWFHAESLAHENRWPKFVPRALDDGISSILSSPLMSGPRPLGALNIYSKTERAFGPPEQELAALFAAHVAGILLDAGADVPDHEATARIQDALHSRQTIARAQGVLMERRHLSAEQAAALLHATSRDEELNVSDHAANVLATVVTEGMPDPIDDHA